MKNLLFFYTIVLFILCKSSFTICYGQGIQFQKYQDSISNQYSNKIIFIEIYLKGCPHCEALVPILKENKVGLFYNKNFINYQIEANSPESVSLQKKYNITYPEFPLFLFFQNDSLIHIATPAEHTNKDTFIEEVIQHGQQALSPFFRMTNYANRFKNGEHDFSFLVNYAKATKVIKDNKTLHVLNDTFAQIITTPQDKTSQIGFYIIKRFINDFDNPLAAYFFDNLVLYQKQFGAQEVKEAGESILYYSLYGDPNRKHSVDFIKEIQKAMLKLGVSEKETANRTILKELESYFMEGRTIDAITRFNQYRLSTELNASTYAYFMQFFNEKSSDNTYLPEMQQWANDGVRLLKSDERNTAVEANIYYELAICYQKMGKRDVAKSIAQKSLQIATLAKIELKKYQQLYQQI